LIIITWIVHSSQDRALDRKELCCFNFKRESKKYFEIPLVCFFGNFLGQCWIQPKLLGWDRNGSNPLNLKRKCHLHAEFLHTHGCGRFQDGRRKSKLAWMEVKRGWYHSRYCREDLSRWLEVVASLEVEKKRRKLRLTEGKKKLEKRWFLSNFAYWFLPLRGMESTYIYRGWKGDMLSGANYWPLIRYWRIPNVGSKLLLWPKKADC